MPKKKKEDHIQLRSTITKALLFTMISLVLFYPFVCGSVEYMLISGSYFVRMRISMYLDHLFENR